MTLFRTNNEEIIVILNRIRKCHHIKLDNKNKQKIEVNYANYIKIMLIIFLLSDCLNPIYIHSAYSCRDPVLRNYFQALSNVV